jgi:Fe-S cluster biogenesis protein NfuA
LLAGDDRHQTGYSSRVTPGLLGMKEGTSVESEVRKALEEVRPMLQADGGDVELVEVTEDGIVRVRLQGACQGCPMSQMTVKNGIEQLLVEKVPGVAEVEAV